MSVRPIRRFRSREIRLKEGQRTARARGSEVVVEDRKRMARYDEMFDMRYEVALWS